MADRVEYRFRIAAYAPETMPMRRLAEYLADISSLFGEEAYVHLIAIESGSTCPVLLIDDEAEPRVLERIQEARIGEGPTESLDAIHRINQRLAEDNASAELLNPRMATILDFPGTKKPEQIEWPSVSQPGELYGVPIWIGGKKDLVNITLQDEVSEWSCQGSKEIARAIMPHMWKHALRVIGSGRWKKKHDGAWKLEQFRIASFDELGNATLGQALDELRAIRGKWKSLDDPLAVLRDIRTADES